MTFPAWHGSYPGHIDPIDDNPPERVVAMAEALREAQARSHGALDLARRAASSLGDSLATLGDASRQLGDPATAGRFLDDAIALARVGGHKPGLAGALSARADVATDEDDGRRSAALYHQALRIYGRLADAEGVARCLEALAGSCARAGEPERAMRLVGAAQSLRETVGRPEAPDRRRAREASLADALGSVPPDRLEAALAEGQALSMKEALAYAAGVRGAVRRRPPGTQELTEAEQQVASLAAEGLTNDEISQQLFISRNTVKTHLARVFAKLGISSRRELTRRSRQG